MSAVRELHERAMELAQAALLERESGNDVRAIELVKEAAPLELMAAERLPKTRESEPTRSILFRSAAALALQAQDFETAERLVYDGLAGFPPPSVRQELLELREQILQAMPIPDVS